jgi:superfamily II DNA or RNA helicase
LPTKSSTLSETALAIAQAYAVYFPERPARSKTVQWINRARREAGLQSIKQDQVKPALEELLEAGLIEPTIEGQRGVSARGPGGKLGTITRFCRSAIENDVAISLLQQLDENSYEASQYRYRNNLPHFIEQHLRIALMMDQYDEFSRAELTDETLLWLIEPAAAAYLQILPDKHRQQACETGLRFLITTFQNSSVFAKTCATYAPDNTALLPLNAFSHVLRGELTKATNLLMQVFTNTSVSKPVLVEAYSILALIHTVSGDDEKALASIKQTIEAEQLGTRKKILYPANTAFSMAIFALLRSNTQETNQLFESLLNARKKLKIDSYFSDLFDFAQQARLPQTWMRSFYLPGPPSLGSVLYAIASRWHSDYHIATDSKQSTSRIERLLRITGSNGYAWLATELQGVLEAMHDDYSQLHEYTQHQLNELSSAQRHKKLNTKSLLTLVKTEAVWEFHLRSLEQLAPKSANPEKAVKAKTDSTRRLKWVIDSVSPHKASATPVEQVMGKNGNWSAGRRVALKRLKDEAGSLQHLLEQDTNAAATITKHSYGWNGATTYETSDRTVFQLIGHPHVYDPDGGRLTVQERPAQISVQTRGDDFVLAVEPTGHEYHYISIFDAQQGLVMVTHFNAAQRRICDTVPMDGLKLPAEAQVRMQSLLKSLSGTMAIQGDTTLAAADVRLGNSNPLLELDRLDDELSVRVRVEPLPDSKTFFDAGKGGAMVYVQTTEGSIPLQRDLTKEHDAMQSLIANSSVLSRFYDGRNTLLIPGIENALELVSELQNAEIRCIWPKNIAFTIEKKVETSQLNLNISSAATWFNASGELRYNSTDALSLIDILERMTSAPESRFIELDKGKYLALSRSLHKQLGALQAFTAKSTAKSNKNAKHAQLHPVAMLALDPLFNDATTKTDKKATELRKKIKSVFDNPVDVPSTLQADLRSYQVEGYEWLARLGSIGAGACLADDMGLGKTVQTLALLLSRAECGPALVVAPTSVIGNWITEAQRFAPSLNFSIYGTDTSDRKETLTTLANFDVLVISYGLMTNDTEQLQTIHWSTVVLDEAQAIKNTNTHRARAAKALGADFRIITTGTPIQNNLMDLHSLFSFTNPGLLGSEAAFRRNFALPIERDNDTTARTQLMQLVSPFMLRRHKRDVLQELPARTDINLSVSLSSEEAVLYETLREEALASLNTADETNNQAQVKFKVLTYLTKLRRLCCNPKLIAPDWKGPESKLELCIETLQELLSNGHKALVFSQFVDHLKIVEERLKTTGIEYQYLDGSTPQKKRTERVNAFQSGKGDVFLISLTAGGTGLNLTAADYVVHLDPWWNPAVEDQASDRAHRFGQQRPVTIYRMVTAGTIEEQIQKLHATKRDLAESVLAGSDSSAVNSAELIALLQHGVDLG